MHVLSSRPVIVCLGLRICSSRLGQCGGLSSEGDDSLRRVYRDRAAYVVKAFIVLKYCPQAQQGNQSSLFRWLVYQFVLRLGSATPVDTGSSSKWGRHESVSVGAISKILLLPLLHLAPTRDDLLVCDQCTRVVSNKASTQSK